MNQARRPAIVASFLFTFVILFITGCLPTYVGNPETATADKNYLGIWHGQEDNNHQVWVIHQMNDHNYLAQGYFIKAGDDGKLAIDASITARAWLADVAGKKFVSMETYSTELFLNPDSSNQRYLVMSLTDNADGFTTRHLAPDFFKDKTITKPAELEKVIVDNLNDEKLYLKPISFKKINPQNPGDLKPLLDLIK